MRNVRMASIGERRLVHWFKEVGPNLGTLGGQIKETFQEAAQDKDPIKLAMAPISAAARVWFQGLDYVASGIVDRKVEATSGSETAQDAGQVLKDVVTLHPLRAIVGVLKLPGDIGMDIIQAVGGFRGKAKAALAASSEAHLSQAA